MGDEDETRNEIISRRTFAKLLSAGAAAGMVALSAEDDGDGIRSNGERTNVPINQEYQIAQNYYAGPRADRPAASESEGTIWEVTDAGENRQTMRTISDGSNWITLNIKAESADVAHQNNTRYADPGQVQSVIDDLASRPEVDYTVGSEQALVKLQPNKRYDEGREIHVKPGVTLDCNGGVLTHSADHNLVFLDNGAHLRELKADVTPSTFSSDAIVLDTSQSRDGSYSTGVVDSPQGSIATATGTVFGDSSADTVGGAALALRAANGGAIGLGCHFGLTALLMDRGLLLDTGETDSATFINVARIDATLHNCRILIDHTGVNGARSVIRGELQPGHYTEHSIRNRSDEGSVRFDGHFWDPQQATMALVGPNLHVMTRTGSSLDAWVGAGYSDGSPGQVVEGKSPVGRHQWYYPATDTTWGLDADAGTGFFQIYQNGSELFRFRTYGANAGFQLWDDNNQKWVYFHTGDGGLTARSGNETAPIRASGLSLVPQNNAPSNPSAGDIVMQSGKKWNPAGSGTVEPVYYDGTKWHAM